MLNPFPILLSFGFGSYFLVPTILRITVAVVFLYLVITHFKHKKAMAHELSKLSHETAIWAVGLVILLELGVAVALLVGFMTQIAAILAGIWGVKALVVRRKFPAFYPLSPLAYTIIAVICLCLLISGAGAFAFDLPL